jgi:hypothetical protein
MPLPPSIQKIWDAIKSQSIAWVSTTVLALLAVFSQTIADHIRTGLNNADAREKCYEKMSQDFSRLVFNAENAMENYQQALDSFGNGNFSAANLKATVDAYNTSITTVRDNQYAYKYQLNTYAKWELKIFRGNLSKEYDSLFWYVVQLDKAVHKMNPIGTKVEAYLNKKAVVYPLDGHDSTLLKTYLPGVDYYLKQTKAHADLFFDSL